MNLFFDTSALIKFFHEEKGSNVVTELIIAENNTIWILELAKLEFISALYRRYRNKEINDFQLTEAINGFEEEISTYNIELLRGPILSEAKDLIKQYGKTDGLRTLDALHLGAFSLISEKQWIFVAADKTLCKLAQKIGFKIINPVHDETPPPKTGTNALRSRTVR
jgi:uncharacterized protein